ncbi:Uu.00g106870.m01.CDS01 [Anthostomella pinea]|uniref:Uu.00g106870.m01.CDS01 n=1 Tax=Anthostomella pinea TaxID=933095 RepID=A0AAI8VF72_9PEZI|nr:Uu.00g106870.m01.CDS01 [Anthostomella pinea]
MDSNFLRQTVDNLGSDFIRTPSDTKTARSKSDNPRADHIGATNPGEWLDDYRREPSEENASQGPGRATGHLLSDPGAASRTNPFRTNPSNDEKSSTGGLRGGEYDQGRDQPSITGGQQNPAGSGQSQSTAHGSNGQGPGDNTKAHGSNSQGLGGITKAFGSSQERGDLRATAEDALGNFYKKAEAVEKEAMRRGSQAAEEFSGLSGTTKLALAVPMGLGTLLWGLPKLYHSLGSAMHGAMHGFDINKMQQQRDAALAHQEQLERTEQALYDVSTSTAMVLGAAIALYGIYRGLKQYLGPIARSDFVNHPAEKLERLSGQGQGKLERLSRQGQEKLKHLSGQGQEKLERLSGQGQGECHSGWGQGNAHDDGSGKAAQRGEGGWNFPDDGVSSQDKLQANKKTQEIRL